MEPILTRTAIWQVLQGEKLQVVIYFRRANESPGNDSDEDI